jgi:CRP-like cAMP-binding protein
MDLARDGRDSFGLYATRYWLTDLARDDPTSSAVRQHVYVALKRAQIPLAIPAASLFVSNEHEGRDARKLTEHRARTRQALLSVELFRGLSDEEIDELVDSIKLAPFASGEVVTRQGAHANWLYVLTQGRVEVQVARGEGSNQRVGTLESPNFFGEMALMTGSAREATVIALEDIQCLRVDREAFGALLERRPEIASEVADVLAERRVALNLARDHLNTADRHSRVEGERAQILTAVQKFFGLTE